MPTDAQLWDTKSKYRGLHIKFMEQLEFLEDFYPTKMARLQARMDELKYEGIPDNHDEIKFLRKKIKRLDDKHKTTLKEVYYRNNGTFHRNPIGTIFYIDLDNGDDTKTGLDAAGEEWKTLAKYTTTTVRTAGDIAKVRANTDELMAADLVFDEDGNEDDYIEIRGCSIADDPWSDGSDVKPILTFGDNDNNAIPNLDDYWKINRLITKESADSFGTFYIASCYNWYFLDCEFTDNSNASGEGVGINFRGGHKFENCIFKDNLNSGAYLYNGAHAKFINCTFDGGITTTNRGLDVLTGARAECIECDFGQTTAHSIDDIRVGLGSIVKLRNCNLGIAGILIFSIGSVVFEEDADGVYGAYKETYYQGVNTKDDSIKTGNATFSMKMEPNTYCGANNPLTLNNDSLITFPFNILCTTGVAKTVTIKIRSLGTWTVYPTATELYIEFSYLSNGASAARTQIASTQVLSHASNWVSFTVTFTPLQTGIAYGAVYLEKFEANMGAYVNMEAT